MAPANQTYLKHISLSNCMKQIIVFILFHCVKFIVPNHIKTIESITLTNKFKGIEHGFVSSFSVVDLNIWVNYKIPINH